MFKRIHRDQHNNILVKYYNAHIDIKVLGFSIYIHILARNYTIRLTNYFIIDLVGKSIVASWLKSIVSLFSRFSNLLKLDLLALHLTHHSLQLLKLCDILLFILSAVICEDIAPFACILYISSQLRVLHVLPKLSKQQSLVI